LSISRESPFRISGGQHGRGGKENPHRHGAHRYKPMGVTETQRGEHYAHPIVLLTQTQCQEKSGAEAPIMFFENDQDIRNAPRYSGPI